MFRNMLQSEWVIAVGEGTIGVDEGVIRAGQDF